MFTGIYKDGFNHHAHIIEGSRESSTEQLMNFLENVVGITIKGNPDVWYKEFNTFGIDDGRAIKEIQLNSAIGEKGRMFIISAYSITREAQNALLKTFEEPSLSSIFFIIIPNADELLPTLRSRMVLIRSQKDESEDSVKFAESFLKTGKSQRLEIVKKYIEDKNKEGSAILLSNIERLLSDKKSEETNDFLKKLFTLKSYVGRKGSSLKLILEYVALTAPEVE